MKVKATIKFYDREAEEMREKDKTFEVNETRAEKLIALGYVKEVPEKLKTERG